MRSANDPFLDEREIGRDLLASAILFILLLSHLLTDRSLAYLSGFLFVTFVGAVVVRERRLRERQRFVNQLKSHRRELRSGGTVVVDDRLFRYDTVVATYVSAVGGLVATVHVPSRYRPVAEDGGGSAFLYTLLSLVAGWWSPHGPLSTISCGVHNLRGGRMTTVAELVDGPLIARLKREQERNEREDREARERRAEEERSREQARLRAAEPRTGDDRNQSPRRPERMLLAITEQTRAYRTRNMKDSIR